MIWFVAVVTGVAGVILAVGPGSPLAISMLALSAAGFALAFVTLRRWPAVLVWVFVAVGLSSAAGHNVARLVGSGVVSALIAFGFTVYGFMRLIGALSGGERRGA